MNDYENEKKIVFEPAAMKLYMDKMLDDCQNWTLEENKKTELSEIRVNNLPDINNDIPVVYHLHYFPDCEDKEFLMKVLTEYRLEWEKSTDKREELEDLCHNNVKVIRTLNKPIFGAPAREFIDKKMWFRVSECGIEVDETNDDIYIWQTHVPDSFYELNKEYVRAHSLMNITRLGKSKALNNKGLYFESMS